MKTKKDIKALLTFIDFTHKFNQVKRQILATGEDHNENDSEHSFQLAITSWYLNQSQNLGLDNDKLIKYGLVHDLVEVYAGDTYFHTTDQKLKDSKVKREKAALQKIKHSFKQFPDMYETIYAYENKIDEESKFIYALDKILPVINIYLDDGKSWKRDRVSYEMIRTKDEKIAVSKSAQNLWQEVISLLEKKKELFVWEK